MIDEIPKEYPDFILVIRNFEYQRAIFVCSKRCPQMLFSW